MTDLSWMIRPMALLACLFGSAASLAAIYPSDMAREADEPREHEEEREGT